MCLLEKILMEIDILISKFLCGEATEKEIAELDKWRQSSIANENEFVNLRDSWSYIHQDSPNLNPDKEKVWNKILNHIIADNHHQSYSRLLIYKVVTAAAVIAVLICVTMYIYVGSNHADSLVCFKATVGQKAEVTLPDGTGNCYFYFRIQLISSETFPTESDFNFS